MDAPHEIGQRPARKRRLDAKRDDRQAVVHRLHHFIADLCRTHWRLPKRPRRAGDNGQAPQRLRRSSPPREECRAARSNSEFRKLQGLRKSRPPSSCPSWRSSRRHQTPHSWRQTRIRTKRLPLLPAPRRHSPSTRASPTSTTFRLGRQTTVATQPPSPSAARPPLKTSPTLLRCPSRAGSGSLAPPRRWRRSSPRLPARRNKTCEAARRSQGALSQSDVSGRRQIAGRSPAESARPASRRAIPSLSRRGRDNGEAAQNGEAANQRQRQAGCFHASSQGLRDATRLSRSA